MTTSDKFKDFPNPQLPAPSPGQFIFFLIVLSWTALAPLVVSGTTVLLPATWLPLVVNLVAVGLLGGFLLVPLVGLTMLAYRHNWRGMQPLALALLMTGVYILVTTAFRARVRRAKSAELSCPDVEGSKGPNDILGPGDVEFGSSRPLPRTMDRDRVICSRAGVGIR